jgi:hypothetical protein
MQLQPELREPLTKIGKELPRIVLVLEPRDEVVGLCRVPDYAEWAAWVQVSGLPGGRCSA